MMRLRVENPGRISRHPWWWSLWRLGCLSSCYTAGVLYIEFRRHGVRMLKPRQSIDCQTSWQSYHTFVLLINLQQIVEFIALA